jgi:hypothetical protein
MATPITRLPLLLQALTPCDTVQSEADPMTLPFEVVFDAPLECVWSKISNWCGDVSWLPGAQVRIRPLDLGCTAVPYTLMKGNSI